MFQPSSMQQSPNNNQPQAQQFNKQNNRKRQRGGKQQQNQNQNQQQPPQQSYGGVMPQTSSFAQSNYDQPPTPVNSYQAPVDNPFAATATAAAMNQAFVANPYAAAAAVNVNQFPPAAVNVAYQQAAMNAYQGYPPVVQPAVQPPQPPQQPYEQKQPVKKNEGRSAASSSSVTRAPALVRFIKINYDHFTNISINF